MAKNVIFLFSQPRSGSTLLQRILAAHEKIDSISETWLLLPQIFALQPRRMMAEYNQTIGQRAITDFIKDLKNEQNDYNACLRSFMLDLYSCSQDATSDTIYFLEKTPRYYLIIKEISEIFPDAKFIFLFRNPLAVMSSIINTWHKGKLAFGMHHADVFHAPQLLARGYEHLKDRSVRINFEDLIRSPDKELEKVFSYLDLEFDPKLVGSYQDTIFRRMKPSEHKYKGLDKKTLTEWEGTFSTAYRARFAQKYIETIGEDSLRVMGIDYDDLSARLSEIRSRAPYRRGVRDRATMFADYMEKTVEWPIIRRRVGQRLRRETIQQYYS